MPVAVDSGLVFPLQGAKRLIFHVSPFMFHLSQRPAPASTSCNPPRGTRRLISAARQGLGGQERQITFMQHGVDALASQLQMSADTDDDASDLSGFRQQRGAIFDPGQQAFANLVKARLIDFRQEHQKLVAPPA